MSTKARSGVRSWPRANASPEDAAIPTTSWPRSWSRLSSSSAIRISSSTMRIRKGLSLLKLRLLRVDGHHDLRTCTWLHIVPSQLPLELLDQHSNQGFSKTSFERRQVIKPDTVVLD